MDVHGALRGLRTALGGTDDADMQGGSDSGEIGDDVAASTSGSLGDTFREAVRSLRPVKRAKSGHGIYSGQLWRGAQHMDKVRSMKIAKAEQRLHVGTKTSARPLEVAWNMERLRAGDKVCEVAPNNTEIHLALGVNNNSMCSTRIMSL